MLYINDISICGQSKEILLRFFTYFFCTESLKSGLSTLPVFDSHTWLLATLHYSKDCGEGILYIMDKHQENNGEGK